MLAGSKNLQNTSSQCGLNTSAFVVADITVRSPRKLFISTIQTDDYRIKVPAVCIVPSVVSEAHI